MKLKERTSKDLSEITIFYGSSPEDVEHAKSFWKSLTLQPPLESRLVSAEIRQRLRVAPPPSRLKNRRQREQKREKEQEQVVEKIKLQHIEAERLKYKTIAERREEILRLLYKQRTERLNKELIRDKAALLRYR